MANRRQQVKDGGKDARNILGNRRGRAGDSRCRRKRFPFPQRAAFDPREVCRYLSERLPEKIEFTFNCERYVSAGFQFGAHFEITPTWCDARKEGIHNYTSDRTADTILVPRALLLTGILDHTQAHQTQGFGVINAPARGSRIWIGFWNTDKTGDGAVWPSRFGELVLRWQRPVHLGKMFFEIAHT
ncbi:hypothetical protein N658DRAFT_318605 [Parathielavia hyrcaniae]|uniref:Uncharacterized protein n=1 Tax=Parathielavia hyrcaniae TaxID=113614 RepID=A0AAN6SXQ4_9PEZI|nr:hypothetical protein N658DRAFT_318605 [Parathielavia hyrcaniae]